MDRSRFVFRCLAIAWLFSLPLAADTTWQSRVDPWVLDTSDRGLKTEFLVFLTEQADLSGADLMRTKQDKGRYVFDQLTKAAARSQGPILERLRQAGVEYRSFWVANMIWVEADRELVQSLASRSDVEHIYANPSVRIERPVLSLKPRKTSQANGIGEGIQTTGASTVMWKKGYRGQTVVIGGQDTGYDWEHLAIKKAYLGWDGGEADHNYTWHDAIHSGGGVCGTDSKVPCDDDDHGTHTMGTMVGDDGGDNRIGMAPDARWIGCRNMDQGVGKPSTYTECFEWFIAPTNLNDKQPDPDRAPDVINNSWSCPPGEGCSDPNALKKVVKNVRAAGIMVVVSAGNNGPTCKTVRTAPAIYPASFTVAATSITDAIANFSSRGPVDVDGSNRMKPDIGAPGVGIRSSVPGNGYENFDGTSMAGPHVAGMAALVLSAGACMRGNVKGVENFLRGAAEPLTTDDGCGGDSKTASPNNTFGWGGLRAEIPKCSKESVGGMVTGVRTSKVVCQNKSAKKKKTIRGGGSSWNCEANGLAAEKGDKLKMQVDGKATEARMVGAQMARAKPTKAICKNATTKKKMTYKLKGAVSVDCEARGLEFSQGDKVKVTLFGKVK